MKTLSNHITESFIINESFSSVTLTQIFKAFGFQRHEPYMKRESWFHILTNASDDSIVEISDMSKAKKVSDTKTKLTIWTNNDDKNLMAISIGNDVIYCDTKHVGFHMLPQFATVDDIFKITNDRFKPTNAIIIQI